VVGCAHAEHGERVADDLPGRDQQREPGAREFDVLY
jgi:hypothetical protein